jgi:arsenate reductase
MLRIYHHPKCRKSREGLAYLQQKQLNPEIIRYVDIPLSAETLKLLLMKLNMKPLQIVRTQEEIFRKELKGKSFTDDEWIEILLQHPNLIQRPIVEGKYKAVVAIPPERSDEVIG